MPTEYAQQALSNLRDTSGFQWYVIPLLVIVLYIYHDQISRKNYSVVFAGLALWGMDWFNEIWNSLVFHFNGYAPVWAAPGETAYLILIGLNIEICFMFAILGIVTTVMLPSKDTKILGLPTVGFSRSSSARLRSSSSICSTRSTPLPGNTPGGIVLRHG
jgi:hypothetical protein